MALSADRVASDRRASQDFQYPMAASAECFAGGMAVLDASGNCKPATAAASLIACGRFSKYTLESTGVAAASNAYVEAGTFKWVNSSSNAATKAHIGDTLYIEDDETVTTASAGTSAAGIMVQLDSDGGVWVRTELPTVLGATGLLAANNLSDVGTVATARANLSAAKLGANTDITSLAGLTTPLSVAQGGTSGATAAAARAALGSNIYALNMHIDNLVAADAKVYSVIAPWAGDITKIWSVLEEAALAVGDATLTFSIAAVAITTGVITITQAGSAVGDIDNCVPSGANTVTAGAEVRCTVGGANTDTDARAVVTLQLDY